MGYSPLSGKQTDMTEWLTVSLRFTHLVAYARISFRFEDDAVPLYVYSRFCLSTHPSWLVLLSLFGYCE